jgi:hypothetical protein
MVLVRTEDDIANERLKELYNKYLTLCEDGALPDKKNVGPDLLGAVMGYCILSVVEPEPFRVFYHAVGEAIESLYNKDLKEKYVDELFDAWISKSITETYQDSYESKLPVYDEKGFSTIFGSLGYQRLILPFSSGGDEVSAFVTCVFPSDMSIVKFSDWNDIVSITPWLNK